MLEKVEPNLVRAPVFFDPPVASEGGVCFRATMQRVFRVEGMAFWGVRDGDVVTRIQFALDYRGPSIGEVPAVFYKMRDGWSYSDLLAAIDRGEEPPRAWGPGGVLTPGQILSVWLRRKGGKLPEDVTIAAWGFEIE